MINIKMIQVCLPDYALGYAPANLSKNKGDKNYKLLKAREENNVFIKIIKRNYVLPH